MLPLAPEQAQRLAAAPVGHLATASKSGVPHVIPVCFALAYPENPSAIYIVLDRKPKQAALTRLRRVRNILENPQVTLVVDHYHADWSQLWYILVAGRAVLLEAVLPSPAGAAGDGSPAESTESAPDAAATDERRQAIGLLRQKYPQYREMDIAENPVIKITPQRAIAWDSSAPAG